MGGGGAIRAAAKVGIGGGLGIVTGGIRHGGANFHPPSGTRPVSAILNSSPPLDGTVAEKGGASWEVDDWEFAGAEEEVLSNSGETLPRMVFGATPTMQEAKEATSELKEALDKVYLSSGNSAGWIPTMAGRVHGLSALTNSEHSETKPCVTSQTIVTASAPEHALQAFKLLSESTAAQTVVASIACDRNVWNAVLENPALVEYLESQKSRAHFQDLDNESVADSDSPKKLEDIPDFSLYGRAGIGLVDVLEGIKLSVLQMVSSVSDVLQNIFGTSASNNKDADGNAKFTSLDKTLGASFMGLAVMVIMVVCLKRA